MLNYAQQSDSKHLSANLLSCTVTTNNDLPGRNQGALDPIIAPKARIAGRVEQQQGSQASNGNYIGGA
jgi:hypothetical protein